jgi:hypothetical protein
MTILAATPLYPVVIAQSMPLAGMAPSYVAAPSGISWRTDYSGGSSGAVLHVKNGGGASTTVTISRVEGLADLALSVPAGSERFFGPFPRYEDSPGNFSDSFSNSLIWRTSDYANASFSVTAGVTYALLGIPRLDAIRRGAATTGGGLSNIVAGTTALVVQAMDAWATETPTYSAAAAAGHHLSSVGGATGIGCIPRYFAHVKNAGGSPTSVTIQARGLLPFGTWTALINSPVSPIVVPAGGERLFTLPAVDQFPPEIRTAHAFYVVLSYSVTASVTVAVFDARASWGEP